jgi:superfamily II DNA or RNA helicase
MGARAMYQKGDTGRRLERGFADRSVPHLLRAEPTTADLTAAQALVRDDLFEAVDALVAHARVSLEGEPAQVVRGVLSVGIIEEDNGLFLRPNVDGEGLTALETDLLREALQTDRRGFVLADAERGLIVSVGIEPSLRDVVRTCLRHPHPIPHEHRAKLVQRLPKLERVTSVTMPDDMRGEEVIADPRLLLRMRAMPAGIAVEGLVNPLCQTHGPVHPPGAGSQVVTSERDGTRIFARRDLDAERAHAERIVARLPLPAPEAPWRWLIADDEAALDLLSAIRELDEPVEAEWRHDNERQLHFAGAVSPRHLRMEVKEGRDWFELSGEVSLAGDKIKLGDLLEAMRRGHRYVRLDLQRWIRIEDGLRERLEKLSHTAREARTKIELSLHSAPLLREMEEMEVDFAADAAWRKVMRKLEQAESETARVPESFTASLRPYQREGFEWMSRLAAWGTGGILADDMGLGKTVQGLALLVSRQTLGPQLVVAPTAVCINWLRECERFAPTLRPVMWWDFEGDPKAQDVVIVSYGIATREHEAISKHRFATLILDEAQAVKNSETARAKAMRSLNAEITFGLSGTPIENHLGELWSLMRVISPGLLGSWDQFRTRFLTPIEKDGNSRRRQMLAELVRPFVLRRTKSEVLRELPPLTDIRVDVALSKEERDLYETARIEAVTQLARTSTNAGKDARFEVLAAITRLRLLACHPKLFDKQSTLPSSKLDAFLHLCENLKDNGHRALVFSQFTSHLTLVREALSARGFQTLYFDGATSPKDRQTAIDAFQAGECGLFLISLKAGGFGLNLTKADDVIHLDPWWNPAVEAQATGRAHRIGQTRPVTVYRLVSQHTIEEQILKLHDDKRNLIAGVLDDNDVAARLSVDDLRNLLRTQSLQTGL